MVIRDKLFIVASNVDDSIKSITPVYDITLFPNFLQFEQFIESTPIKVNTIIISERELPFTNTNMARLLELLSAPFLKRTGPCVYLIDNSTMKESVESFMEENGSAIVCYQGDLSARFIGDVVQGAARSADEEETIIRTYRMKASEYDAAQRIKKYETDEDIYVTDEEDLAGIPDEPEPEVEVPSIDVLTTVYYVVGKPSYERTLFTFIEAQYLSLTGKTLIIESDVSYHRLTDMVLRSTVDYEFIDIENFMANPTSVIGAIRNSISKLIVIGCRNRYAYNYNFICDILFNNLLGWINYFVKECDFDQTPYGSYYNIVCADTVPDVLECCSSLAYDVEPEKVIMVGVRTGAHTEVNINSAEMSDICKVVLDKPTVQAEVVEANGINLRGEDVVYDVFSIISRGNERQG